jgi:hypothetical protein
MQIQSNKPWTYMLIMDGAGIHVIWHAKCMMLVKIPKRMHTLVIHGHRLNVYASMGLYLGCMESVTVLLVFLLDCFASVWFWEH